jgi:acetyl esterase/lipase
MKQIDKKIILITTVLLLVSMSCGKLSIPVATNPVSTETQTATPYKFDKNLLIPSITPTLSNAKYDHWADPLSFVQKDVTYCTMKGVPLLADIYFPQNVSGPTPLLIFMHGGGFRQGNKDGSAGFIEVPALLNAGFMVISVNYRLAPDYLMPAMIEDVKCAVRSFRAHASELNIDPNMIGVWGSSAGGHLAAMLGTSGDVARFDVGEYLDVSSRVQAAVDMFGPADFLTMPAQKSHTGEETLNEVVFGTIDRSLPIFAAASPVTYISADDPPILILHGDADTSIPLSQSQDFYDKLKAAGVDATLVVVKGGEHGLRTVGEWPTEEMITQIIVNFFILKLKG